MKPDNRKKILAINATLFAILYGIVSLNKKVLRPASEGSPTLNIITGCLPNLVAAYFISLALVTAALVRKFKHARIIVYSGSFVVFLILTAEEIKPMWGASTYYDPFDIIATGIGSSLAVLTYEILKKLMKKQSGKTNRV